MPFVESSYQSPKFAFSGHIHSIVPSLFRKIKLTTHNETIATPDDDFLELSWNCDANSSDLVILSHGLEGHTERAYILGMQRAFVEAGYDTLAWNFRGCGNQMNNQARFYHSGATDDLSVVIEHAAKSKRYQRIVLVGFSMGGNISLLYLGKENVHPLINCSVVFSVPCDLKGCSDALAKFENVIYMKRFLKDLKRKVFYKAKQFPSLVDATHYHTIKNFQQFDDKYTAPLHGFIDALDYWQQCSSLPYIAHIKHPTLMINAQDDSFLGAKCFPKELSKNLEHFYFEMPKQGGHCGFLRHRFQKTLWSELRAVSFVNQQLQITS